MYHLYALLATPPVVVETADMSWLGPAITAVGGILVAVVGGVSFVWRRRQERRDAQADRAAEAAAAAAPKVTDGWDEVRKAHDEASGYYNLYRTFEDLFYVVFTALRRLARNVRAAHPDHKFEQSILDALAIVPPGTSTDVKK